MKKTSIKLLGLSTRIYNALIKVGIETIEELEKLSNEEIVSLKGISVKSRDEINLKIKEYNANTKECNDNIVTDDATYIFTKKAYIKEEGRKAYVQNRAFVNKMNGRKVECGCIDGVVIKKHWCIRKTL